ncbi:loricrin-like [Saccostrea cucullata]|uniref:loricrin-like n=1 Tax=Saccostrea cuccullata TaxID=36930 RepID=UPI002ED6716B
MFLQSPLFLFFIVTSNVICGFKINKQEYHKRSGFLGNQFSGSDRNGGDSSSAGTGFPASNERPVSFSGNLLNANGGRDFSGSSGSPFNSNGNAGIFPGSTSGSGGNQGGDGPFSGNGGSGGFGGGSSPFNSNGNGEGGFPGSNSGNGAIQGGGGPFNANGNGGGSGGFGSGSSPFSNGNGGGGGFSGSNSGNGAMQGGGGPFNANGGSGGSGSGSSPFSIVNGNSNSGGSMSSGGSPFSNAAKGGGKGMGPGPFSTAGNAGGSSPFKANGGKMASPFSTAAKAGSGETPFKISNSALGGKSPFGTSTFQGVDFGSMGGALATNNAVGNPMDASSLVANSGGPGGLTGSSFATNIDTDGGPGGLTGGSFQVGTDSSGPGGLAGGGFPQTDNTNGAVYINTDSDLGDRQSTRFDTAKYEQMLSQLYNPNNYESQLLEKPFDGKDYSSSNSNSFGSGVNYVRGHTGHSSAGSLSGGKQTDEPGPFDTRPFKQVQSPFISHAETQYKGSNYHVDAASSLGGHNYAAVGYSGGTYNIDSSASSRYNAGNAASYVTGSGTGSSSGYETPFDKHVDNYNELISNPFNSNMKSDPGSDYSHGSFGTPFESQMQSGGMGSENPGGNPFRQGGNKAGMSMTYNNRPFSG